MDTAIRLLFPVINVEIPDDAAETIQTVGDAISFLEKQDS